MVPKSLFLILFEKNLSQCFVMACLGELCLVLSVRNYSKMNNLGGVPVVFNLLERRVEML